MALRQKLTFSVLLCSVSAGSHILYPVSDQLLHSIWFLTLTRFFLLDCTEPVVDDFLLLISFLCRLRRGPSFRAIIVRMVCYGLRWVRFSVHHFGGQSVVILSELWSWTFNMLLSFTLTFFGEPALLPDI